MEYLSKIEAILDNASKSGRQNLSEPEVYAVLKAANLNVPQHKIYPMPANTNAIANDICSLFSGDKIVIKLISAKLLHKTESGGVMVCSKENAAIQKAFISMYEKFPQAEAFMAVEFMPHSPFALGEELLLGARSDDAFGPVITLGPGGTHAENLIKALNKDMAPSIMPIAFAAEDNFNKFISKSWIWNYCSGNVRGSKKLAEDQDIIFWIKTFSAIMAYFRDNTQSKWAISEFEINPLCLSNGRITALDGVLRFRAAQKNLRNKPSKQGVNAILNPKAIAVIGVSEKKMNMGRIIANNVVKAGFPKEHIYIVKPDTEAIDGIKCVPIAKDLPEIVDMCVIAVPSTNAKETLKAAADSGKINGVVLISGGIGEKDGSENAAQDIVDIVNEGRIKNPNFAMSGANSMGIVLNNAKVNTFFIPEYKLEHPVGINPNIAKTAFVSQSGAFVISAESTMPWLKPMYSITVGNQQDITVVDYLDALCDDELIKVLLVYIEGFKPYDGLALAKIAQKAKKSGKKIVLYKAGRTAFGQKAAMGHTASIAGDYFVTANILEKSGILMANSFDEFYDFAQLACHLAKYGKIGRNTFMISNAGFEAVGMADAFTSAIKTSFPDDVKLIEDLQNILNEAKLNGLIDVRNPFDITPMAPDTVWLEILKKVLAHGYFDGIIASNVPLSSSVQTLPAGTEHNEDLIKNSFICEAAKQARASNRPIILCVDSGYLYEPYCNYALKLGLPVFRSADRALKMYSRYIDYLNEEA